MDFAALCDAVNRIEKHQFDALALEVFRYQSIHCEVYRRYLAHLGIDTSNINKTADIPYLPIEFYKRFQVKTGNFESELCFESSSTGNTGISKHHILSADHYRTSFRTCFNYAFGDNRTFCHLALLPSYLERSHSSLVFQVDDFIRNSKYSQSAFFLRNHAELNKTLIENEKMEVPTILWGVSFALLDFIEEFQFELKHTRVIETGGMKGRRMEITREELHALLKGGFGLNTVAGEYGMTELMSQAYAPGDGLYLCPPSMRVTAREINDPLSGPVYNRHGAINICDLNNIASCAFIASSDLGKVYDNGSFEILGRLDHSDTRGCNLLV